MFILFSSIIAPAVAGCIIVWFKHMLESRSNDNK
ncbi:type I toxin-antitoxin system Fst family toxin [Listeria rustica]|uniref:Type I toxin-antitoxin system Fst family toxin n=1 Tax=Listeria rustica TaxID=2713503 RepID=A0A7W1T398_9LIST|nr:type I toxin-antitoxin system Fst family toxin [Listeria rustica]MBA3924715.1 type I toxin-antitoxin system Fst family toxin [Listeria rustica]